MPFLAVIIPGKLAIVDNGIGRVPYAALPAVHQRCQIDERFKDRARLALGLKNPVELRFLVTPTPDHRLDLAGLRPHNNDCTFQAIVALASKRRMWSLEFLEALDKCAFRFSLQLQIEAAENPQPLSGKNRVRIILVKLASEIVHIKRCVIRYLDQWPIRQFLAHCGFVLPARDNMVFEQFSQNYVAPLGRGFGAPIRGQPIRRADQTGNQRWFTQRQVAERFGKIELRGLRNAKDSLRASLAEINLVQIIFQDCLFRILALSNQRHDCFRDFAAQCALVGQEEIFHELLSQCAAALLKTHAPNIHPHGAQNADRIDTAMAIKTLVLNS